jgi:hypothetical protein
LGGGLGFGSDAGGNKKGGAFPVVEEEQLAPIEKAAEVPISTEEGVAAWEEDSLAEPVAVPVVEVAPAGVVAGEE